MSYTGHRLAPLFSVKPVEQAARRMADMGGEKMTANVKRNTPIGHQPYTEDYIPGALRASIEQKVMVVSVRGGSVVYETGAETNLDYAPYVEEGTGLWGPRHAKYEIKPKRPDGWLRFVDQETGEVIFARKVMHPGSPGNHMFAIGAAITEHEFNNWAQREVQRWAREQEREGMRQRPIFVGRRLV